jgi:hypothetical protein
MTIILIFLTHQSVLRLDSYLLHNFSREITVELIKIFFAIILSAEFIKCWCCIIL